MSVKTSSRSQRASSRQMGCYLYAVIDNAEQKDFGPCGIDGGQVYALGDGRVAAVVSDLPNEKIRPERRRLAAHHEVLKRLMAEHTVLPMSFGLLADGPEAVRRILANHRPALVQELRRLVGKVEMGLHVVWDVPNFFEYFVNSHEELAQLRDQVFRGGRMPTHEDKLELGRLFDRALMNERSAQTRKVCNALRACCQEIKENKPRNEHEVMNLACLIDCQTQKEFEKRLFEAAGSFDNHYAFDFNGPWPPHNFVEVALELGDEV